MTDKVQKTILLVEDEALIAMSEKMTLEGYGYRVLTAYTGERAIESILTTPCIDLVLMDIDLGRGMDGTVAARKILETHDIPVVFLSSHTEPEVVEKTEGITSYGYIVKNSGETILIASIRMAFRLFEARKNEKKKEEAIIAEKDINSLLINSTPAFFISIDKDFNITSANTALLQASGYSAEEIIGRNYLSLFVPEREHDMLSGVFNRLLHSMHKTFNENHILTKDGMELLCEWYGTPIVKDNMVETFIGMGVNITGRRQIEQTQRIHQELVLELNTCTDLRQQLDKVLNVLLGLDCFDCGAIYLADPADNSLEIIVHQGLSDDFVKSVSHFSPGSARVLLSLTGEAHYGKYTDIFRDLDEFRLNEGLRAFATIPVMNNGRLTAVLNLASHTQDFIPDETRRLLETIAFQVGGAILRLRSNADLLKSEEIFRQFMDNSPIYVFFKDDQVRPIRLSRNFETMLGKPVEELLGKTMDDLFPSALAKSMVADDMRVLKEGKPITIEEELNGRFYSTVKFPIHIEGKPVYLSGYTIDITERKQSEQIQRFQNDLFIDLNSCSDLKDGMEMVLAAVLKLDCIDCGAVYTADPADGTLEMVVHHGLSQDFVARISHFEADSPTALEVRAGKVLFATHEDILPVGDEFRRMEGLRAVAIIPIMSTGQLIAVLNVASRTHDSIPEITLRSLEIITLQIGGTLLRLRTDAAFRKSEELFRSFIRHSMDGIVIIDSQGIILEWNDGEERITGLPRSEAVNRPIWEVQYQFVPDELKTPEHPEIARNKVLDGLKEGAGLKRVLEEEIQRKDGSRRIIQTILFGIPNDKDNLAGAICRDITDQKNVENDYRILLQENILLLKEVHHRIKNNISAIESLLSLHANSVSNPEAISILKDTISRVQVMKVLYDNLLLSENYSDISSKRYFEKLIETILFLFLSAPKINIETNISDFVLTSKIIIPIGIIINELITNALKYAFSSTEEGVLQITISKTGDELSVIVADNGVGLPAGFDNDENKGFGYTIIRMLIKQIDGTFSIIREKGTKIIIECPV